MQRPLNVFSSTRVHMIYDKNSVLLPKGYSLASRLSGCVTSCEFSGDYDVYKPLQNLSHTQKKGISRFLPQTMAGSLSDSKSAYKYPS